MVYGRAYELESVLVYPRSRCHVSVLCTALSPEVLEVDSETVRRLLEVVEVVQTLPVVPLLPAVTRALCPLGIPQQLPLYLPGTPATAQVLKQ